ncbi:PucR family transcriptional regulator [Nakamurella leprariae]|uniref:Helix-turn-helix domain-containing protein n=1 Tax=Nakamurella leprariae TaxID=2803911 RepID=A0A938YCL6_9ACTN|nr:helix-turn-helix domain-containing protein [Nakamurella leprariae]MBM9465734.1 helix-turn-helix domain-containing protein [Nakamurella leprariae]
MTDPDPDPDPEVTAARLGSFPTPGSASRSARASTAPGVSDATLTAVERAAGRLARLSVALMDQRLSWFGDLSAQQRSWVTLVAQAGISGYTRWVNHPAAGQRITGEVFSAAPREFTRSLPLRRTVELLRIAIVVAEEHLPTLADGPTETAALRESLLRYSREVAFAAASVYAIAAETRGAWDARLEAAVVDGIVRGEDPATLSARAAALDWDPTAAVRVVVGTAPAGDRAEVLDAVADWASGRRALAGVQGDRLVVVVAAGPGIDPDADLETAVRDPELLQHFGSGPVVTGRSGTGLRGATGSAAEAAAGLRVASAWPAAPRPIDADDLLVERVLAGDERAARRLRGTVYQPLAAASGGLLDTIDAYLTAGGGLEPAARSLFVHPNTVRYRLRRVTEITGRDPWHPRDLAVLRTAVILGRLADATGDPDVRP